MSEIRPCPFCGGVAVTYLVEEGYYTGCSSANTCEMRPGVTAYTWNECRAAWNTRASDACASVQKERDEAVEVIRYFVNDSEGLVPAMERARAFLARYEGGR